MNVNDLLRTKAGQNPENRKRIEEAKRALSGLGDVTGDPWTDAEEMALRVLAGSPDEPRDLQAIADRLQRTKAAIAVKLSKMGLTSYSRPKTREAIESSAAKRKQQWSEMSPAEVEARTKQLKPFIGTSFLGRHHTEEYKAELSKRTKEWLKIHGHPKGMKGKHHSKETKLKLSEAFSGRKVKASVLMKILKTKQRNGTLIRPRNVSWKQGWRTIGGKTIYARSKWEANYARALEFQKRTNLIAEWEHEPKTFWFEKIRTGTRCYIPDFRVTYPNGNIEYHEVKGWMDPKSKTKLNRMRIYHPTVFVRVIDSKWFSSTGKTFRRLCSDWEM